MSARGSIVIALLAVFGGGCVAEYVVPSSARADGTDGDSTHGASDGEASGSDGSGESESGTVSCSTPTIACGDVCADLMYNPDHCGRCDASCGERGICDRGECRDDCRHGLAECDRYCVDTSVDPNNCGACGRACGADESCVDGSCRSA